MNVNCDSCGEEFGYSYEQSNVIDESMPIMLIDSLTHSIIGIRVNGNRYCSSCVEYSIKFINMFKRGEWTKCFCGHEESMHDLGNCNGHDIVNDNYSSCDCLFFISSKHELLRLIEGERK